MIEEMSRLEILLLILAILGGLHFVVKAIQYFTDFIPLLQKAKAKTWNNLADLFRVRALRKRAIASGIENVLNQVVSELRRELPEGWISRASIQWVGKTLPATIKDRELILRIRPHEKQDFNYLNAIYYFFSNSIFPNTQEVVPSNIKKAASLYLSKRSITNRQPYLIDNFEKHFFNQSTIDEQEVVGYYGDYIRIDEFGFFNSAFIREVDTLAASIRLSRERKNIENEICNILNHLLKFEKLNKLTIQTDEWHKKLSATSYGFLLVARPDTQLAKGIDPYVKRARQQLKYGVKRLYVFACQSDEIFFNKVVVSLRDEIREYKLYETFNLYKDYRGQQNGKAALFIIDTVREAFLKNISVEDEIEDIIEGIEKPLPIADQSSVIASEQEIKVKIIDIAQRYAKQDGWIYVAELGAKIKQNIPLFNSYHYGYSSLRGLLYKLNAFEFKEVVEGKSETLSLKVKPELINNKSDASKLNESLALPSKEDITLALTEIIGRNSYKKVWTYLAVAGGLLRKRYPSFEPQQYGYTSLKSFLESTNKFDIKQEGEGQNMVLFAKLKSEKF